MAQKSMPLKKKVHKATEPTLNEIKLIKLMRITFTTSPGSSATGAISLACKLLWRSHALRMKLLLIIRVMIPAT